MPQPVAPGRRQGAVRPHLIADLPRHALYQRIVECSALGGL